MYNKTFDLQVLLETALQLLCFRSFFLVLRLSSEPIKMLISIRIITPYDISGDTVTYHHFTPHRFTTHHFSPHHFSTPFYSTSLFSTPLFSTPLFFTPLFFTPLFSTPLFHTVLLHCTTSLQSSAFSVT